MVVATWHCRAAGTGIPPDLHPSVRRRAFLARLAAAAFPGAERPEPTMLLRAFVRALLFLLIASATSIRGQELPHWPRPEPGSSVRIESESIRDYVGTTDSLSQRLAVIHTLDVLVKGRDAADNSLVDMRIVRVRGELDLGERGHVEFDTAATGCPTDDQLEIAVNAFLPVHMSWQRMALVGSRFRVVIDPNGVVLSVPGAADWIAGTPGSNATVGLLEELAGSGFCPGAPGPLAIDATWEREFVRAEVGGPMRRQWQFRLVAQDAQSVAVAGNGKAVRDAAVVEQPGRPRPTPMHGVLSSSCRLSLQDGFVLESTHTESMAMRLQGAAGETTRNLDRVTSVRRVALPPRPTVPRSWDQRGGNRTGALRRA
jgi:hypothetical protein